MSAFEIVILAVALAMDCFSVCITAGATLEKIGRKNVLLTAFMFGFFQGLMPIISWCAGVNFDAFFANFSHWIALILLNFLGIKIVIESLKTPEKPHLSPFSSTRNLLLISVATSIDALSSGVLFIPFGGQIFLAAAVIAFVSFAFSIFGVFLGKILQKKFHFNYEFLGGILLIFIGLKIFLEHIFN